MKLLGNRVCVEIEAAGERKTKHGFVLPEEDKDYYRGVVTHIGSSVIDQDLQIGVTVLVNRNSSSQVSLSKNSRIFNVSEVLAVIQEE